MKKFLVILLILVVIIFTAFYFINIYQQKKIKKLELKVEWLKEVNIPLKFKILDKNDSSIQVSVKFLNSDGKEINKVNLDINGKELAFDFIVVPIKDRFIAFPNIMFSDVIAPVNGKPLIQYYDKDNFPQVFFSEAMDDDFKMSMSDLFSKVKTNVVQFDSEEFGNAVHDVKEFKSFLKGQVYKIVVHTKGGIEVLED